MRVGRSGRTAAETASAPAEFVAAIVEVAAVVSEAFAVIIVDYLPELLWFRHSL